MCSYAAASGNLTWLQRQQQKLKERRDLQRREERQTHETQLISELRTIQSRHMRPTASHRLDGYTSDTTAFADDDDDFAIPLHINTTVTKANINSPTSPILPNRTSSMKRYTTTTNSGHMTTQSLRRENERPFVAVKRAHEQSRKYSGAQVHIFCLYYFIKLVNNYVSYLESTTVSCIRFGGKPTRACDPFSISRRRRRRC